MKTLSTGHPSTLGSYMALSIAVYGDDSPALDFLRRRIKEAPNGKDEEVVQPESQMLWLLGQIHDGAVQHKG